MVSRELLEACRKGDRGAFEELVERTRGQVYTLAYRLVGDRHDAEDVAQDAYLRVYRGLSGFREDARFETWLYRVVTNAAFTHLKRRGRFGAVMTEDQEAAVEVVEQGAGPVQQTIDRDEVKRALEDLPESLRTVVVLRDVYGLSLREIGQEMGISEGAAKVRLHRARKKMKDKLWTTT
ncbi:MAG TPA: sigma-70 family RNA polymerase sigma factor [Actinomycetota bacterium]|nr:sigma-70 family RNA polymerase sigma factor [Actinomycetota bacterium]